MKFINPHFLWAIIALLIPIIVHLFNLRRYKKEFFTNTALLKTFINETKKTSVLKKRILLACRLLALFFLILAFAQPYFSSKEKQEGKSIISIYLDNSMSMDAPSGSTSALEVAKKNALDIVQSLKNNAEYHIIANDFKGSQLQILPFQEAISAIKSIEISSQNRNLTEIWKKQSNIFSLSQKGMIRYVWISDFQKNQMSPLTKAIEAEINCIPIPHTRTNNIYIDTAFITTQAIKINQDIQIVFRLKKSSIDESPASLITFHQNDVVKTRKEIHWNGKTIIEDTFRCKITSPNWQNFRISISDANLTFDNEYLLSFYLAPRPTVSIISGSGNNKYLFNALKADDNFEIIEYQNNNISNAELDRSSLIILNQIEHLSAKVEEWIQHQLLSNKNLVIFLPPNALEKGYSSFFKKLELGEITGFEVVPTRLKSMNRQDALLNGIFTPTSRIIDLPSTKAHYVLSVFSSRPKEALISLDNSNPFLLKYSRLGEGDIYLFTSLLDPDQSNFVFSSMFAPLMYKIGSLASNSQQFSYLIDESTMIRTNVNTENSNQIYRLVKNGVSQIPPQRKVGKTLSFSLGDGSMESGFYQLQNQDSTFQQTIALNYSRKESIMEFYSTDELLREFSPWLTLHENSIGASKVFVSNQNTNLWKFWLGVSLFFLILEMFILFFWDKLSNSFRN